MANTNIPKSFEVIHPTIALMSYNLANIPFWDKNDVKVVCTDQYMGNR